MSWADRPDGFSDKNHVDEIPAVPVEDEKLFLFPHHTKPEVASAELLSVQ